MLSTLVNINALLITNPINIRYLTGFVGLSPDEREAYVLLTPDQLFLFTSALYSEQARLLSPPLVKSLWTRHPSTPDLSSKAERAKRINVIEISRENPLSTELANLTSRLGIKTIGFEESNLTFAEYHKIMHMHKNVILVPTQSRIEKLRMIKREDEIDNIRVAAKFTDQCFSYLTTLLKPRVTETQIAWEIESFIRTHGAELAFSPIVAFGKNSSHPHYMPHVQGSTLQGDDIVLLDFGARVNGYCADMTRVICTGKPKDEWVRAYQTVCAAQKAVLDYLDFKGVKAHLPGDVPRSGAEADRVAREIIENAGFPTYPHSLGHGVGLDIHEAPRLSINKDSALKPGMVITVEPAIYVEGDYGVRIEDLVLLTKDGVEILSRSSKALTG